MAEKKWLIVLGIINVLAAAGILFWYVNRDHTPPVISREGEIIYEETMSDSELLQGAVAFDETDGDVSHTLVVEKVIVNQNAKTAVVTCGAVDDSGNIAKQAFQMKIKESAPEVKPEPFASDPAGEVFTLEAGEAAIGAETTTEESAEETTEEATEEQSSEEAEEEEMPEEAGEEAGEQEAENAEETENTPAANVADTPQEEVPQVNEDEIPVLYFAAEEVVTNRGYNPAWVTVIEYMRDNKDSYEDLLKNIKITGEYTNSELGTYNVMVSTVDSDGHESVAKPIRIIVVE